MTTGGERRSSGVELDDLGAPARSRVRAAGPYVVVACVVLVVYRLTLLPGVGYYGDTAKFQFVGKVLGIPHATGYPTYVVVNRLFVTLPLGTLAVRANLLSAVCAAGAVVLLTALLRLLGARTLVACATALAFAFTSTLWSQSVIAEVYALHLLFVAAVTYLLVSWSEGASNRYLLGGLALFALAFGNHLTTVTVVPAVLFVVLAQRGRAVTRRNVLFAIAAAAVGASQYLFLVVRARTGAAYLENSPTNLSGVWYVVSGAQFKSLMFTFSPAALVTERVPLFAGIVWDNLSFLLIAAVLGLILAGIPWRVTAFLLILALGNLAFALNYDVPDIATYLLPTYLVLAVFAGLGLEQLVRRMGSGTLRRVTAAVVLVLMPLVFLVRNYADVDQSHNTSEAHETERILAAVGERAIVLSPDYNHSEYLWYYLIGLGFGRQRGVHLAHDYNPDAVAAYLRDNRPLLYTPGRYRHPVPPASGDLAAPPGLRVYIVVPEQAAELAARGLVVHHVDGGVSEVTAGSSS